MCLCSSVVDKGGAGRGGEEKGKEEGEGKRGKGREGKERIVAIRVRLWRRRGGGFVSDA